MSLGITIPNRNTVFVFLSACIKLLLKAGVAQLVERQPSKLKVAGSSLVSRSNQLWTANQFSIQVENGISRLLISNENYFSADINTADVAQLVERIHGKDEVTSSNLVIGSNNSKALTNRLF